jgi:Mrp family chromosome partitioning ATPase
MSADDVNILHRLLRSLVGDGGGVVQWLAADPGEGVTSLALDMAILRAQRSHAKVLLVDVEPVLPGGLAGRMRHLGARLELVSKADQIFRIGETNLYVTAPMCGPGQSLSEERWARFFTMARRDYPLTVVDTPALRRSTAGLQIAPLADLNLLVVEAEVTRAQVVAHLARRVESANGYVSGAVLNKRRFHIPQFLYSRV